jgi:hypothetical protein
MLPRGTGQKREWVIKLFALAADRRCPNVRKARMVVGFVVWRMDEVSNVVQVRKEVIQEHPNSSWDDEWL